MELNCHETLENTSVPKAGDIIVVKEIKVQTNFYSSMTLAEGHIVNKIKEEPMSQENLCSGIGPIIYIPGAGPNILVAWHDQICGRVDDHAADVRFRVGCSVGLMMMLILMMMMMTMMMMMMMRLMTAAGWAAALVWVPWLCPTFATAARHTAQRHGVVHIPKAHPGRAGHHAAAAAHHAVGAEPAPGADRLVPSFFQNCRLRLTRAASSVEKLRLESGGAK